MVVRVGPATSSPRAEGWQKVVVITTLGNYSRGVITVSGIKVFSTIGTQRCKSKLDILCAKRQDLIRNRNFDFPLALGSSGEPIPEDYPEMLFEGQKLRELIARTPNEIELRNEYGRCCRTLSSAEALGLNLDLFVAVGNLRRIKFLRRRTQKFVLNAGSHTTRRLKDEAGINIAHPLVREHRPFQGNS
jgi:hypothetical protein